MVDWSLQSPSLHCYFRNQFKNWSGEAEGTESKLDRQPGLFDLFVEVEDLMDLPSTHIGPDEMLRIAGAVQRHIARDDVDGVVVTHGTATIAPLFPLLKSYSLFMSHPSYCFRSCFVALASADPTRTPRRTVYAQMYISCNHVTGRLPVGA